MNKNTPSGIHDLQSGGIFDCLYDEYFTLIDTDGSLYQFLGYTQETFNEQFHGHLLDVIYPEDREPVLAEIKKQLLSGNVFMYENRMVAQSGALYWVWISAEVQDDPVRGPWFHCAFHDITREKQAREQLAISEQRYEIILAQMQDIIFELDCQTFEIYYSPNFEKKFGYSIPVQGFPESMFATDIIFEEDKAPLRHKFQHILQGGSSLQQEYRLKKLDGTYLWVEAHATAIRDASGKLLKIIGIITDINSRKQEILEIRKVALLDPLTSLLNRRECIRRVEEYIQKHSSMSAFLLIDVDNFKTVNDTMGHAYGDSVLTEFAAGLRTLFRQTDIIARLGGDEFVVFMTNIREKDNAITKIGGILQLFSHYGNAPETCALSCSIGCSFYPEHGNTFSTLSQKADAAMYHAKKRGKAQYYIYEEGKIASFGENGEILPERTMQKSFHDHIIEYVFRFFLEHPENAIAIPLLLEQLGSIFHAERICIYEKDEETFRTTFQWHAPGYLPPQEGAKQIFPPLADTHALKEPVITYPDTSMIENADTCNWFLRRNTRSAIVCFLSHKEELLAAVLYEDCKRTRQGGEEERYTLSMISEIIHLFLSREQGCLQFRKNQDEQLTFLMDCIAGGMMGYYLENGLPLYFINSRMLDFLGYRSQADYAQAIGGLTANGICGEDRCIIQSEILRQLEIQNEYETEYRMIRENGELIWVSGKGKRIITADGREAVICLCYNINEQKKAEMKYQQDLQLGMAFNENLIASFRCNLSTNHTEYVEGQSLSTSPSAGMSYEALMELHNRYVANQEDTLRIRKMMNREALLNAFSCGQTILDFEYRRKDSLGCLSWVCATIRLIQDAQNGNLYAYGTLQDITEKKNMELALKNRAERDVLTGVYNKDTAIQIITDAMKKAHYQKGSYALLVFNVDHFTQIVHSNGYMTADSILQEIASQLLMRFTKEKIIGRFYGDEFLVYIYNNPKPDLVKRYAEEVRKAVSMPYLFPDAKCPVSVCAGIVFDNHPQTTFDSLYQKARLALIAAKASGRNNCQVYTEQLEALRSDVMPDTTSMHEPLRQEYSGSGESILLKCMYAITSSIDFRESLEGTLKELGRYYNGDRVYMIELEKKEREVRNIYEWKKDDAVSIRDTGSILLTPSKVSAEMHKRLRQLRYCDHVEALQEVNPATYRALKQIGIHSYLLATLDDKNFSIGYIGIDNPKRNTGDTSVINTLRYVLANELVKRRLQDKQQFLSYHDELTGVLNRNSFKEYCENLSEEGLISLGVISLDINGLKEINRIHGNSYGDDVVCCIARALEDEFPFSRVYRFTGDEFLIVCENMSCESFNMRLRKLKERCRNICGISIGSTWSDSDIHLDSLMHNADERRMIAKQTYYDDREFDKRRWNGDARNDLLEKLHQNRFCIYLQPKIDSRDSRLYGAEALVRYQDPTDGLVPPVKFVPVLENAGLIHYIDFFVLEQVCQTLRDWEERGLIPVPISLNFSRSTLLVDDLITRMDEIVNRCGIKKSYLEIEITESIGEVERSTIAQIGNQIRQAGYQIALDDFGAKYSNISFLSILQFHHLKLDKGLVNNLTTNESARLIVKNIMNLCRELDINVIAEGVESKEQLDTLKELQCCYIQGYYYDKPATVLRFEKRYLMGEKDANEGEN